MTSEMSRSTLPSASTPEHHTHSRPAPLPTPPLTLRGSSPSPSERSCRKPEPLFTLSPAALPPSEAPPDDEDISVIWNVVSRAADVVKDGERLENLAWRHWSDHRVRRRSSSSTDTASSVSIPTPVDPPSLRHRRSFENRRSFTNKLKLLVEENSFKDWIEDARQHVTIPESPARPTPRVALPGTPTPNLEIRLVEPTPVPSRVGSLGVSVGGTGSTAVAKSASQPPVREEEIEEESGALAAECPEVLPRRKRAAKGGFFIHQSPGKVSGTSDGSSETASTKPPPASAEPEPAAPTEQPQPEQPDGGPADASQWRSSAESSSAVVMKKKERRHVSMATMRGRFQAEKRIATQAIAARNKQQEEEEDEDEDEDEDEEEADGDDDDWEDDEEEDDTGVDESSNKPTSGGDGDDNEDDWEDEMSSAAPSGAPSPRNAKNNKKERSAAAARLELEKEALRKRTMFAKMQIDAPAAKGPTEGLLSRAIRTGKSMVDLTQAGAMEENAAFRRTPTHANFTMAHSPAAPAMLRSKSVVAMPVHSGVSVTGHSHRSGTSDDKRSHRSGTSDGRQAPNDVEMESSDDDSDDDNYLASSQVRAKLDALDAKRAARNAAAAAVPPPPEPTPPLPAPVSAAAMGAAMGDYDEYGVARPISPTSRRRMIIMREMSESLRRNIILEREKSSGPARPTGRARPPPSVHTSRMSAMNLTQLPEHARENGAVDESGFQRHSSTYQDMRPEGGIERHNSQPNLTAYKHDHSPTSRQARPPPQQSSVSPTEHKRRQNLLGHGFLRPLTRADTSGIGRTRSAAALNLGVAGMTSPTSDNGNVSPSASSGATRSSSGHIPYAHLQAPPMLRSSTEGDHIARERARKRELTRRSERTDTGYRYHGW